MLITISGLSGSGKSSAAEGLSRKTGVPTVDVGQIFRRMAKAHGMDVTAFGPYAEAHPEIDRALDAAMLRKAKRAKNIILQSRLSGLMTHKEGLEAIRVWIKASARVRASRVAKREGIPFTQAYGQVTKRDRDNRRRYMATYGLDVNDLSVYDVVIPTDNLSKEEVVSCLVKALTRLWPTKKKSKSTKPKKRPPKR